MATVRKACRSFSLGMGQTPMGIVTPCFRVYFIPFISPARRFPLETNQSDVQESDCFFSDKEDTHFNLYSSVPSVVSLFLFGTHFLFPNPKLIFYAIIPLILVVVLLILTKRKKNANKQMG